MRYDWFDPVACWPRIVHDLGSQIMMTSPHFHVQFLLVCLGLLIGPTTDNIFAQEAKAPAQKKGNSSELPEGISAEARAAVEKGVKLFEQEQYKQAVNTFLSAVRLHPTNGQFHYLLGAAYLKDQQAGRAWLHFRRAVRLRPPYQPAAQGFLALWATFDRRGVLNVGRAPDQIQRLLGKPDAQKEAENRLLWEYGFMRIHFVNGRLSSIIDPRGLDPVATKQVDTIKVQLDPQAWRLGYRSVNRLQTLSEYVPIDQSVQEWKELFTLQRLYGMTTRSVSPKQMMEQIEQNLKQMSAALIFEVVADNEGDVMFQWRDAGSKDRQPQHEIVRLVAGEKDIHRIAYSRRVSQLAEQDAQRWIGLLRRAQLAPISSSGSTP